MLHKPQTMYEKMMDEYLIEAQMDMKVVADRVEGKVREAIGDNGIASLEAIMKASEVVSGVIDAVTVQAVYDKANNAVAYGQTLNVLKKASEVFSAMQKVIGGLGVKIIALKEQRLGAGGKARTKLSLFENLN